MKDYRLILQEETATESPPWMTLFISLMLVVLTLFIFLTTFAETDKEKIAAFKKHFRENLLIPTEERKGSQALVDMGTPVDPLRAMVNRMKSEGINKKLMDDFLTLNQIKDLEVRDGEKGISVILPEVVGFETGDHLLTGKAQQYLTSILPLIEDLPYLVVIKGYATPEVPNGYTDALEFSAKRAGMVYNFLLEKEIPPIKLKVAGCGDAFEGSDVPQDKVEIIFKEGNL